MRKQKLRVSVVTCQRLLGSRGWPRPTGPHSQSHTLRLQCYVNLLFWYQFFCGFSGSTMIDYWQMIFFNLFFTSLPPLVFGVLDKDISAETLLALPELYKRGQNSEVRWRGPSSSLLVSGSEHLPGVRCPCTSVTTLPLSSRVTHSPFLACSSFAVEGDRSDQWVSRKPYWWFPRRQKEVTLTPWMVGRNQTTGPPGGPICTDTAQRLDGNDTQGNCLEGSVLGRGALHAWEYLWAREKGVWELVIFCGQLTKN